MWIYAPIFLLFFGAWSESKGTNQSTSVNASPSPTYHSPTTKAYEIIESLFFNEGSDVNLTCSDKPWNETIYVIWTITFQKCRISLDKSEGQIKNECNDNKSLISTPNSQPYLHIPDFSHYDEGVYKCESPYNGGTVNILISVSLTVPPKVSVQLDPKGNQTVAVCKAERGKPAASISWSHAWNSSSLVTPDGDGFFTVQSNLELPEGTDTKNLSCVVRHPCWEGGKSFVPEHRKGYVQWLQFLTIVVIIGILAGFLFITQKQLRTLGQCQQSNNSTSKSPRTEDVEEVEPYASYVQRVNAIYNSSADLFK